MKYIDKAPYRAAERQYVVDFLQQCFSQETNGFYPAIDSDQLYQNFSHRSFRKGSSGWEQLLLQEQEQRCCYCMRRLQPSSLNIEHVIPRNLPPATARAEFQQYTHAAPVLAREVMLSADFAQIPFQSPAAIAQEPKMPHRIALANLLASCNGKNEESPLEGCCCNNYRGHDYLLPLMLMPEVAERVSYDGKEGLIRITPSESSWEKIISLLNKDTYKEIRKIWYKIATRTTLSDATALVNYQLRERIDLFKQAFSTDNFEKLPEYLHKYISFHDPRLTYWHLLLSFDWFFCYFRSSKQA